MPGLRLTVPGHRQCRQARAPAAARKPPRMHGVPNRSCNAHGSIRVVPVLAAGDAAGAVDPQAGWWRAWRARFGLAEVCDTLATVQWFRRWVPPGRRVATDRRQDGHGRQREVHGGGVEHGQQRDHPGGERAGRAEADERQVGGVALGDVGGPALPVAVQVGQPPERLKCSRLYVCVVVKVLQR